MENLNESKTLDKYIEYVKTHGSCTIEELKADLAERGLAEQDINYVMTFYKLKEKQEMFENPFSFNGRIRRLEYWLSYLLVYAIFLPVNLASDGQVSEGTAIMYLVLYIPILWFSLAQGAKRCHDRGNSGWYQIIPFYSLWMFFGEGEEGENDYGSDPKGRD